jgi:hypothetical protein
MCTARELEERQRCMEINVLEAEPGTEHLRHPRGSPALAVKRYARPAAGRALPLPEEIRPIDALERTTAYLISLVDNPFSGTYAFIADRLRAVVQDLVVQAINNSRAAAIYERIIRFHALSAVRYAEARDAVPSYSAYHNHELLSKALVSLMHIYAQHADEHDADAGAGVDGVAKLPRSEFHGYQLLLHATDPMLSLSHAGTLDAAMHRSAPVELALRLLDTVGANDGLHSLHLIGQLAPTALGCALHLVPRAREAAMSALRRAYLKDELLPARWLCALLLLPPDAEALRAAAGSLGVELQDLPSAPSASAGPDAGPAGGRPLALEPTWTSGAGAEPLERLVVRLVQPTEDTQLASKEGSLISCAVATSAVQAWRAGGTHGAELVRSPLSLWPAGTAPRIAAPELQPAAVADAAARPTEGAEALRGGGPAAGAFANASGSADEPPAAGEEGPAAVAQGEQGEDALLKMMNTLRVQINTRPEFLTEASQEAAARLPPSSSSAQGARQPAEDDELALALKELIAMMSGGTLPREGS